MKKQTKPIATQSILSNRIIPETYQEQEDPLFLSDNDLETLQQPPIAPAEESPSGCRQTHKIKNETPFGNHSYALTRFVAIAIYNRMFIVSKKSKEKDNKLNNFYQNAITKSLHPKKQSEDEKNPTKSSLTSWFQKRIDYFKALFEEADSKSWVCHDQIDNYIDPPDSAMRDLLYIIQREESTSRYKLCLQEFHKDKLFQMTKQEVFVDLVEFCNAPQSNMSVMTKIKLIWETFKEDCSKNPFEHFNEQMLAFSSLEDKRELHQKLQRLELRLESDKDASTTSMRRDVDQLSNALEVFYRLEPGEDRERYRERIYNILNEHFIWKCLNKLVIFRFHQSVESGE